MYRMVTATYWLKLTLIPPSSLMLRIWLADPFLQSSTDLWWPLKLSWLFMIEVTVAQVLAMVNCLFLFSPSIEGG